MIPSVPAHPDAVSSHYQPDDWIIYACSWLYYLSMCLVVDSVNHRLYISLLLFSFLILTSE